MQGCLFVLVAALLGGCAASGTGPGTLADVTVELDASSGLPNPEWTLTPEEAGELARLIDELPAESAPPPPVPGLGYRGFRIRNPGGEAGIFEDAYVARGGALRVGSDPEEGFGPAAAVERWLLERAGERGYSDL